MRCFIGSFVPTTAGQKISELLPSLENVRWVKPERYHVTLEFIGDHPVDEIPNTLRRMTTMTKVYPIRCRATHFDGFPKASNARVVIVSIESDGQLESLVEDDRFQAHVTVGYVRRGRINVPRVLLNIPFTMDGINLVESKDGIYRIINADASAQIPSAEL